MAEGRGSGRGILFAFLFSSTLLLGSQAVAQSHRYPSGAHCRTSRKARPLGERINSNTIAIIFGKT